MTIDKAVRREATAIWRYLRGEKRPSLYIAESADGVLWWSDTWVALRVGPGMTRLLADYNLKPKPMACAVGSTLIRVQTELVKLDAFIAAHRAVADLPPIEPLLFGGRRIIQPIAAGTVELWSTDGSTVAASFHSRLLGLIERNPGEPIYRLHQGEGKPMVRLDVHGAPIGYVMPVLMGASAVGSLPMMEEEAA